MEQNEMLLQLRKAHRLSQAELAAELGIARQTVSRWEAGLAAPSSENLIGLSRLYGLPVEEIYRTGRAERQEDAAEPAPEPEEPAEPAPEPEDQIIPEPGPKQMHQKNRTLFISSIFISIICLALCVFGILTNSIAVTINLLICLMFLIILGVLFRTLLVIINKGG